MRTGESEKRRATVARESTDYFQSVFDFCVSRWTIYYCFCLQLTTFHTFPTIPKPIEYYVVFVVGEQGT